MIVARSYVAHSGCEAMPAAAWHPGVTGVAVSHQRCNSGTGGVQDLGIAAEEAEVTRLPVFRRCWRARAPQLLAGRALRIALPGQRGGNSNGPGVRKAREVVVGAVAGRAPETALDRFLEALGDLPKSRGVGPGDEAADIVIREVHRRAHRSGGSRPPARWRRTRTGNRPWPRSRTRPCSRGA